MKNSEIIVKFSGSPIAEPFYESKDFKMYSFAVDKAEYPYIKHNKYGDVTCVGDIARLSIGNEYLVTASEQWNSQYGYSYRIKNIKSSEIKSEKEMKVFLAEILTENQAETLWNAYPDIVQRVVENRLNDIDFAKLKGIKETAFAKIVDKIRSNYQFADIISEFNGLFSMSTIKKLYNQYTSIDMIRKKLNEDPYKFLTNIDRIGFKRADQIILKYEKDGKLIGQTPFKISKERCMAFIRYALQENLDDGNTKMDLVKLQKRCSNEVKDCAEHFVKCIKEDNFFYDKDEMVIAFSSVYKKEKKLAECIKNVCYMSNKFKNDFCVDKYKACNDIELSDEQLMALQNLNEYNISILIGNAGTGKSATTRAVIDMLKDMKKSYLLLAPTGRASKVLTEYTGCQAYTIHRGLQYNPVDGWGLNHDCPVIEDVVIVDEFSMVDIFLFYRLIDAIDFQKTRLLIIGDAAQLSSVKAGNCLHDMINSGIVPVTELTKVFRYADGGLMKVATDCRNQMPYLNNISNKMTQFGKNKDYTFVYSDDSNINKNAIGLYKKLLDDGVSSENIMVTSAYNKGDYGIICLNNQLQKVANHNYGSNVCYKTKDTTYYVDDIIMQTVNNYKSKTYDMENDEIDKNKSVSIYNGETGKIVKVLKWGIVAKFNAGYVAYNNKELQTIQLGYAFTTLKSQGGASDYVIIITPQAHTFMLTSNLLYVALTRTKKKCFQFGQPNVINRAVKKKDEEQRSTFLLDFLLDEE